MTRIDGVELIIMIVATFAQALSGSAPSVTIIGVLIVWRFLLGIGVGGDYPQSAVITSEFASTNIRGRMMNAVFACQGWGNLTAALVGLIVLSAYKSSIVNDAPTQSGNWNAVDPCWRLLIGLGCIPGVVALYFRLTIPETPRFTMDIERNIQQATKDIEIMLTTDYSRDLDATLALRAEAPRASWRDFKNHFSKWENFKVLFGYAYSWFALDIAFYGLGLNTSAILQAIGFESNDRIGSLNGQRVYDTLRKICAGHLILSAAGLIPGYWVCFFFIDSWGRRPIQLMGFTILTILFVIMGFAFDALEKFNDQGQVVSTSAGFFVLYCLANFFQNFGPNTTTFIVPGEAFPTRYRSTAHGISAGSGKLGAIVTQVTFNKLKDIHGKNKFIKHMCGFPLTLIPHVDERHRPTRFTIFAFFMLTGVFSTLLIPETKGKSLEELSNEDQEGFYRAPKRPVVRRDLQTSDK
ncbi:hypothetical protein PQX77_014698 [Marasmius sp. AFHP31]|nr:hypothetical protein PQX77_014698 [Marasmius sp. AFHP31]